MADHFVPDPPTNLPYVPSSVEKKFYLMGLASEAAMIACSSSEPWNKPTGAEAYIEPKEFSPFGDHPLEGIWEDQVGPAMDDYLLGRKVECSILHPVRLGTGDQVSPPPVIMIGINHDTLSAEDGVGVATHCRSILEDHGIKDVDVILYESKYQLLAGMHKPALTVNPVYKVREPFSTSLGIPICCAKTPHFEGTGGFFFVDSAKPGKLFMLTARHVVFHPDEEKNETYKFGENSGEAKHNVLLMGTAAFQRFRGAIEKAIGGEKLIIEHQAGRITAADDVEDEDEAEAERQDAREVMAKAKAAMEAFEKLLADVDRDWTNEEDRVLGHVTFSPPISFNSPDGGFTEDFAVIEINPQMVSKANFAANAIDVGSVGVDELKDWMYPRVSNLTSFKYPNNRLLSFSGTVPDDQMYKPDPKTKDQDIDPVIMVMKNGNKTGFTVGRLNTIRAFVRTYFEGKPGTMSKEIAVLPRSSKSGTFSDKGDSGSVVIDGKGRVCGLLTGGDGATDVSDCTFLSSITWLIKCLAFYGINANIFPTKKDL
ncbi:hypothetical protein DENSPDRAFT_880503 [Dentipellis sp. KUC8613]|nr:hypothetical protein DENSPDRAFT_880503 [Dentipellis sp. KUC8613]